MRLQDAARKRRRCSKRPGAWASAVISSDSDGGPTKFVTKERWEKLKVKVRWIGKQIGVTDEFTPSLFKSIQVE